MMAGCEGSETGSDGQTVAARKQPQINRSAMNSTQLDLPTLNPKSPEETIRENLENALIRYKGDIQAYYSEHLKKVHGPRSRPKREPIGPS